MGTHLRVLSKSIINSMNTSMTEIRCFSKIFASLSLELSVLQGSCAQWEHAQATALILYYSCTKCLGVYKALGNCGVGNSTEVF